MYSLMRLMPWRRYLHEEVPALAIALILAELFYKFHSFTLEALAFLATWSVVEVVIHCGRLLVAGARTAAVDGARR
jgi:hypothetical protein